VTPADVITEVRRIVQDTAAPYRYSDTDLLGYINQTLKRMALLRPDLFGVIEDFVTTASSAVQTLPTDAIRLIDVFSVKGGSAVTETDRETMDRNYPSWSVEAAGTPVNYMRHVKNPTRFFLYPPPASGVQLVIEYAKVPPIYALNDTIAAVPTAFLPTIVSGAVYLAQSIDDEHVSSGRAKLFLDAFTQDLAGTFSSRTVTDTKAAGLKPSRTTLVTGEVI
jgi:hypothetical protein